MRNFDDQRLRMSRAAEADGRLATPSSLGFRHGMSCAGVIACKLGAIYDAGTEIPADIETVLQTLDRRLARTR